MVKKKKTQEQQGDSRETQKDIEKLIVPTQHVQTHCGTKHLH